MFLFQCINIGPFCLFGMFVFELKELSMFFVTMYIESVHPMVAIL